MLRRLTAAALLTLFFSATAFAQGKQKETPNRASATDFTVQLFMQSSGELSPDIFKLEEFGVWNFSAHWKGEQGGKFSGFLVRVKLESKVTGKDIYAQGRQAQLIFRDRKTKKILKTWNISDIYIGDNGVSFVARFFDDLDCALMEATLISGPARITRELPFACGE